MQTQQCLDLFQNILGKDLLGVYLFGSSVHGGIQKYSDIDLFVIANRNTTQKEKAQLVEALLKISGIYMKEEKLPIEMTIVKQSDVNPWQYPPQFDFQYGEWMRDTFEQGTVAPWDHKEMPDLAVLITQILLASKTLFGPEPDQLLCKVPHRDFMQALTEGVPDLISELESDTRNVLLTLARIWSTVETDAIFSKPAAANWAIERLPPAVCPVMERARAICRGKEREHWEDLQDGIQPCADYIVAKINQNLSKISSSHDENRSIVLA